MAGAELQSKLQRQLQKQQREEWPSNPGSPCASASVSPRRGPQDPRLVEDRRSEFEGRIRTLAAEGDRARRRPSTGHAAGEGTQSVELSAEVARLRVDVEVLRCDLESAQREVRELRASDTAPSRLRCEAPGPQGADSPPEAAPSAWGQLQLGSKVRALEEEVASHVVGRVRLEALLRKSEVKETEMRRLLDAANTSRWRSRGAREAVREYQLDKDDAEEDRTARRETEDLETSYDTLELSGLMPLERALQLARRESWICEDAADEAGVVPASAAMQEDAYEGPLRELQLVLSRLRDGAGSGGADDVPGTPAGVQPAAGTGEAADDLGEYGEHLDLLQEALGRLGVAMATKGSQAEEPAAASPRREAKGPAEPAEPPAPAPEQEAAALAPSAPAAPFPGPAPLRVPLGGFGVFSPYAMLGQKYRPAVAG